MNFDTEEQKKARLKALHLLEYMDRTEIELKNRLVQSGFSGEAVQDAVEYVKSFGYVDDERYAHNYILGRMGTKSRQKILHSLIQKGVKRDIAERVWEEILETAGVEEPDERKMIRKQILKKYTENTILDEKEMRRLSAFLMRRGFCMHDISKVLEDMEITVQYKKYKTIY